MVHIAKVAASESSAGFGSIIAKMEGNLRIQKLSRQEATWSVLGPQDCRSDGQIKSVNGGGAKLRTVLGCEINSENQVDSCRTLDLA